MSKKRLMLRVTKRRSLHITTAICSGISIRESNIRFGSQQIIMQLLDLPNEILLKILDYGGLDALVGGPSQSCHRLRELSEESQLWHNCLSSQFKTQYLSPNQISRISDYREWALKQRTITRRTLENLDLLVSEMREASPEDIEVYSWQILKYRLAAKEALELVKAKPRTIAHYHWAHWLTEVLYRLEGVHLLLKLSTLDNWGNGIVERPIDQIIALYMLRNGKFPEAIFNAVYYDDWEPTSREEEKDDQYNDPLYIRQVVADLARHVFQVFSEVSRHGDFLAVLGRGALFVEISSRLAPKLRWNTRLLKMPLGSFVCVEPSKGDAVFVDFQREGKLRTLEEIRDRINRVGATGSVQCGISLYDTLATSYVWHTVPTTTRHCVLDLIEHAASDVKVTRLAQAPRLYNNLVRRIINRNISEVENAPLSRAVSSASLASMFGSNPGGWLRRGKIVRVLAGDQTSTTDTVSDSHNMLGVIIEVTDGTALVLKGSEKVRVIKQMLQPASHVPITTVAGLQVPDIGTDLCSLGQYFMKYNVVNERFE